MGEGKILLIFDETKLTDYFKRVLSERGYLVKTPSNFYEGIESLKGEDLIKQSINLSLKVPIFLSYLSNFLILKKTYSSFAPVTRITSSKVVIPSKHLFKASSLKVFIPSN